MNSVILQKAARAALALVLAAGTAGAADLGTGPATVTIDNGKANPVPVTGEVTLSGTSVVTIGDTTAPIPVTGTVGLAGTPGVVVGNTQANPVPVGLVKRTTQLLGLTRFTLPAGVPYEVTNNVDVGSCAELRFTARTLSPPAKYPVYCRLYDNLTGALLIEGSSTYDNSQTLLLATPSAGTLTIVCTNYDTGPAEIKAALYCR